MPESAMAAFRLAVVEESFMRSFYTRACSRAGKPRSYGMRRALIQIVGAIVALAVGSLVLGTPLAARAETPVRIVALGDSLTAGFGLAQADAFPAMLERALRNKGLA